MAITIKKLY
ncbi:uncharacterized protein FFM5_15344 [Fusarium fujikuroi]|nr:uncharacterized protein FFM5_15344 [Fusarium fujikuroi]